MSFTIFNFVSRALVGVADELSGDATSESASLGLTGKTFELELRVICETLFTVSFNDLFDPL